MRFAWLQLGFLGWVGCVGTSAEPAMQMTTATWGSPRSLGEGATTFNALGLTIPHEPGKGQLALFDQPEGGSDGDGEAALTVPFVMKELEKRGEQTLYALAIDDAAWPRPTSLLLGPGAHDNRLLIFMDDDATARSRDVQVLMLRPDADAPSSTPEVSAAGIYVQGDRTWRALTDRPDQQDGVWSVGLREDGTGWVHEDGNTYAYDAFGESRSVTAQQFPHLTGTFEAGVDVPGTPGLQTRRFVPDRPVDATTRGRVSLELVLDHEVPVRLNVIYDAAPNEVVHLTTGAPDGRMVRGTRRRAAPSRHPGQAALIVGGDVARTGTVPEMDLKRRLQATKQLLSGCVSRSTGVVEPGVAAVRWTREASGAVKVTFTSELPDDVRRCMDGGLLKMASFTVSEPYDIDATFEIKAPPQLNQRPAPRP